MPTLPTPRSLSCDPCWPPLPSHTGVVAITLAQLGVWQCQPQSESEIQAKLHRVPFLYTAPKCGWGNCEEILLPGITPGRDPALPCTSNELPPLLQTTRENQGKQEAMLQLNTSAVSITSLLISP